MRWLRALPAIGYAIACLWFLGRVPGLEEESHLDHDAARDRRHAHLGGWGGAPPVSLADSTNIRGRLSGSHPRIAAPDRVGHVTWRVQWDRADPQPAQPRGHRHVLSLLDEAQ